MRKAVLLFFMFWLTSACYAGVRAVLPGLVNPFQIVVDDQQIYITEGELIYIFSRQDFSLIKKFGKLGEGPQEFKVSGNIGVTANIHGDRILVNSINRVSFFTKKGKYLSEVNKVMATAVRPFGDYFVANKTEIDKQGIRYLNTDLLDQKFKKIKTLVNNRSIVQQKSGWQLFVRSFPSAAVCSDRLFVMGLVTDFTIKSFDLKGEPGVVINQDYDRVLFSAEHRNRVLQYYKNNPVTRPDYDWWSKNIRFPERFPAVRKIYSDGCKLFVRTFLADENGSEFYVFDSQGQFLKKIHIPVARSSAKLAFPFLRDSAPFTFFQGKFYQLKENESTEQFELFILKLNL